MTVMELIRRLSQIRDQTKEVVMTEQESRGSEPPWKVTLVIEDTHTVELTYDIKAHDESIR